MPSAPAVLAVIGAVFLGLSVRRAARGGPDVGHQARTWATIGVIFGAVSAWLFLQGR